MSAEATELVLFIDNDPVLYRQKEYIFRALARKKDRRTYKKALAPKAFAALTNLAAKKYIREHGSLADKWNLTFSPIHRRQAALVLVEQFENWYDVDYQTLKRSTDSGSHGGAS
jgi:hypothetical protein